MTRSFSGFLERLKVWARTADQHRLAALLVMALAAMTVQLYPLSQQPQVALSQQVKRLDTDAKLYWGVAQNLANGTGFPIGRVVDHLYEHILARQVPLLQASQCGQQPI
jgi:hypothetical protein